MTPTIGAGELDARAARVDHPDRVARARERKAAAVGRERESARVEGPPPPTGPFSSPGSTRPRHAWAPSAPLEVAGARTSVPLSEKAKAGALFRAIAVPGREPPALRWGAGRRVSNDAAIREPSVPAYTRWPVGDQRAPQPRRPRSFISPLASSTVTRLNSPGASQSFRRTFRPSGRRPARPPASAPHDRRAGSAPEEPGRAAARRTVQRPPGERAHEEHRVVGPPDAAEVVLQRADPLGQPRLQRSSAAPEAVRRRARHRRRRRPSARPERRTVPPRCRCRDGNRLGRVERAHVQALDPRLPRATNARVRPSRESARTANRSRRAGGRRERDGRPQRGRRDFFRSEIGHRRRGDGEIVDAAASASSERSRPDAPTTAGPTAPHLRATGYRRALPRRRAAPPRRRAGASGSRARQRGGARGCERRRRRSAAHSARC